MVVLEGTHVVTLLKQFRTVLLVVLFAVLGVVEPVPGEPLLPLVTPLVAFLVFSSIRAVDVTDLASTPLRLTIFGLLTTFVVLPSLAVLVGSALLSGAALAGVLVIAAGPATAGSALVWSRLSRSDVLLTAVISIGSIVLAPLATPYLVVQLLGAETDLALVPLVRELVFIVGGGALLSWVVPDEWGSERLLDDLSLVGVGLLVYIGVAGTSVSLVDARGVGLVALVALAISFVLWALAMGLGDLAALPPGQRRSLFFGATLKNLGVAIVVASLLPIDGIVMPVVTFYVVQQVFAGAVVATS